MWKLVAAGLECRAAATAGEVMVMRADVLLSIVAARMRLMGRGAGGAAPAPEGGGTQRRRNPDGSETVHVTTMDGLAAFLNGKV